MKWFQNIHTLAELRSQYRELLKKYHPDCPNGSKEITQQINAEYDTLFRELKDGEDKDNSWKYESEDDTEFKNILNRIIHFNARIECIGSWIWVFEAKEYKDILKELGFRWACRKKAWTWHAGEFRKHSQREIPLDEIRAKYGSETMKKKAGQEKLATL